MKEVDPQTNGKGEWQRPTPVDALKEVGLKTYAEQLHQHLDVFTIGQIVLACQNLPLEYFSKEN